MSKSPKSLTAPGKTLLIVVAAPAEFRAVRTGLGTEAGTTNFHSEGWLWAPCAARPGFDLLQSGIGKANAAAGLVRVFDPSRHSAVLNIGIAGVLPGAAVDLGQIVAATRSVYADEGLATPDGFIDCETLGFPMGPFLGSSISTDLQLLESFEPLVATTAPIATVSTCSGIDRLARQVADRTGAAAEGMEGAALAHIAARLGVPFIEVRAISNTTGDRNRQRWDVRGALEAITRLVAQFSRSE